MYRRTFAATLLVAPLATFALDCSYARPEAFASFFERFGKEPAFAISRTVFPLQFLKWEYGIDSSGKDESAPVKSFLPKESFANWKALNSYMKDNGLQFRFKKVTATVAVVDVFKDSSDWLVSYHFKVKSGCWYLWQYEDQSL